ncbi:MAG TPA: hypothetical protein VFS43_18150 [Polyangiaceae bacterium]|nr:hypothetical protein [Polyangiaceae bacterium]
MTREMTMLHQSNETGRDAAEAAGGPTREIVAGALLVTVYLALWVCVSATVFAPVSAVLGLG